MAPFIVIDHMKERKGEHYEKLCPTRKIIRSKNSL